MRDAAAAKDHRDSRKLSEIEFANMMSEEGVVILDPRGRPFHANYHIKGSVNLPYTYFDPKSVASVIPSKKTKVLIYCRNNISEDFLKSKNPAKKLNGSSEIEQFEVPKTVSAALTIPTYITLYQYGYRNVWELSDVVNPKTSRIEFVIN